MPWLELAKREQGGERFVDESIYGAGVGQQYPQNLCCACVTYHQPDHLWWRTK